MLRLRTPSYTLSAFTPAPIMRDKSSSSYCKHAYRRAFTLIELLVVIAIIGILIGITFGVARGVQSSQNEARAKADLASIAQGLEQFKSRYGDYPYIRSSASARERNEVLTYALTGRGIVESDRNSSERELVYREIDSDLDADEVKKRPKFIDIGIMATAENSDGSLSFDNLLDPWGNPYVYLYKESSASSTWEQFGYHLYSTGPDGEENTSGINASTGVKAQNYRDAEANSDNIFGGE